MYGFWRSLLFLLLGAALGLVVASFWTSYSLEILTVVVLLNVMATITLWRRAARRPEKLRKKFLNQLWRSKPITPKHQPPPPLEEGYAVGKADLQFFSDFEDFANVINWRLAGLEDPEVHPNSPWRLQELPESLLSALSHEPAHGRRYEVFHNQVRLGEIEVATDWNYSTENPRVRVHIELDWVRLLYFGTIRRLLTDIAEHISDYRPGTVEYVQTNQRIDLAMTSVLWKTQEISQFGGDDEPSHGEIEVELEGLASFYLRRREALRRQTAAAAGRAQHA
jgi:hypothetical protein